MNNKLTVTIFNATGISKYTINPILQYSNSSTLLFITETWLLPPNRFLTHWQQHHTYGQIRSHIYNNGKNGISVLINLNCQFPVTIIPDDNPQFAHYLLSCIIAGILYHCIYIPPSTTTTTAMAILQHLPTHLPTTHNTIYCGDFNAQLGSYIGDHRNDGRSTQLKQWITLNGLTLWNKELAYGQPTFYHYNGQSIIDLFISNQL
ncbi:Endonuclease/exonuclease/phosphatase [Phascolomyces articulosus]|uniref:Endonuclease/exonuclease/phosphatase n=1 Tax=Phascolomyces articulosus TaxID=60185 RepID=A0AAD5KSE0_9FUNG|nr:Endonuclease/exonuclease/phosphatase [Phascolomyces articulosus]